MKEWQTASESWKIAKTYIKLVLLFQWTQNNQDECKTRPKLRVHNSATTCTNTLHEIKVIHFVIRSRGKAIIIRLVHKKLLLLCTCETEEWHQLLAQTPLCRLTAAKTEPNQLSACCLLGTWSVPAVPFLLK